MTRQRTGVAIAIDIMARRFPRSSCATFRSYQQQNLRITRGHGRYHQAFLLGGIAASGCRELSSELTTNHHIRCGRISLNRRAARPPPGRVRSAEDVRRQARMGGQLLGRRVCPAWSTGRGAFRRQGRSRAQPGLLGFGPRAIADGVRRLPKEIRKIGKNFPFGEIPDIGCSDGAGAGRVHPQPFRDRQERVVGETTAIVVSSAGFIAAPTFEAALRTARQPFWGRESACGDSAKRKGG
jgi:hypothetical protein